MPLHRFRDSLDAPSPIAAVAIGAASGSFVVCPMPVQVYPVSFGAWAADLYRMAYEQARIALEPPCHVRNLFASMN